MPSIKRLRLFIRIVDVAGILLVLVLSGFLALPLDNREFALVSQVGLQRTRAEVIVKDVMVLAYRPESEHAQAISQLQLALPIWQQVQDALINGKGNRSLGIPANAPGDVALQVAAAQPDYSAILVAAQTILTAATNNNPVDPIQVDIVMQHERDYVLMMSQVSTLYQQHIDDFNVQIYWIRLGIALALLAIAVGFLVVVERAFAKLMKEVRHGDR